MDNRSETEVSSDADPERYRAWCEQPGPFATFVRSWEQLPSELQYYAFGFIACHEDKSASSNLSLVSQAWSREFRPRLFGALELSNTQDCQTLYRILRSRTSAWLTSHVDTLQIHMVCFLSSPLWMALLHLLPQCRTVDASRHVADVPRARLSHSAPLKSALRDVTALKLFHCDFPSLRILLRVIADITFLETIELRDVTWSGDPVVAVSAATDLCTGGFRHIRWVYMWSCTNNMAVPAWILATASTRHSFSRQRTPGPAVPPETSAIINLMCTFFDDEAIQSASFCVHENTPDSCVFGGSLWTPYKGSDSSRTIGGVISMRTSRSVAVHQPDAPDAWFVEEIDLSDSETIGDNPDDNFSLSYLDTREWSKLAPMLDTFRQLQRFRVIGEEGRPEWSFRELSDRVLDAVGSHRTVSVRHSPNL